MKRVARTGIVVGAWIVGLVAPLAAEAQCRLACALQRAGCVQSARATKQACREQCRAQGPVAEKLACLRACRTQLEELRRACRSDAEACVQVCAPAVPEVPGRCLSDCVETLKTCARTTVESVRACFTGCDSSSDLAACLNDCAATRTRDARSCASAFLACLDACRPVPPPSPCACGTSCTTTAGGVGICIPQWLGPSGLSCSCAPLPCRQGQCVELSSGTCTGVPCSLSQSCPGPGQVCDVIGAKCACLELQPCTTDADCVDLLPCTRDRCTPRGCEHQCMCVGLGACGPGPWAWGP